MVGWPIVTRDIIDSPGYTMVAPEKRLCSGQVTKWTYQRTHSFSFRAIVFRPVSSSDSRFQIVGVNDIHIPAGLTNTPVVYSVPEADRITVHEDDVIGWSFDDGAINFTYGGTTNVLWAHDYVHSDLVAGRKLDFTGEHQAREYSIHATVESSDPGTLSSV